MKFYIADLWPRPGPGSAQVPFLYNREHNEFLNKLLKEGKLGEDERGRFVELER